MPLTACKSQKQVGKLSAPTIRDANRQMAKRKSKEYEVSVPKAGRTAPLGLESTPARAREEETVSQTSTDMAQAAKHYCHPSFPR
jgi:hypothetical protein